MERKLMVALLPRELKPESFNYPPEFLRVVGSKILKFEPWEILAGEELFERQEGLLRRYVDRYIVVFARRTDNDDVACWDLETGDVAIVHDYASPGWEQRGLRYPDFKAWLRAAFEEFIDYE